MVILDTHVIIWDALKPELVTQKAREAILSANKTDGILFCDISLWEIAMLMHKKRIIVDAPYLAFIDLIRSANRYIFKGITPEIADLSVNLANELTQDPVDRIICATSIITGAPLITADKNIRKFKGVSTIW
jgi:PIN domain nuclease of toxin-antitoxin system